MFAIYRTDTIYCSITDGIIGSRTVDLGLRFETQAWAEKKAGLLWDESNRICGDSAFHARHADGRHLAPSVAFETPWADDGFPF